MVGVAEVKVTAHGAADLMNRMGHRRLHPHAQHIQLEQAEVLHVLLVCLDHRVLAARGGLHGQPVQQRSVGQDDAARVHGVAPHERVQSLSELEQ